MVLTLLIYFALFHYVFGGFFGHFYGLILDFQALFYSICGFQVFFRYSYIVECNEATTCHDLFYGPTVRQCDKKSSNFIQSLGIS